MLYPSCLGRRSPLYDLDELLEYSLEVLDPFEMEAIEIHKYNKFLNYYALPLHQCREMGCQHIHVIFNFLDERLLSKDELRDFFFGSST